MVLLHSEQPGQTLTVPLLILIGEKDDWTPSYKCKDMEIEPDTTQEVTLKVYPDAHHGFDVKGIDKKVAGHQIKYDRVAAKDAIAQVKSFLAKNFQ